MIKITNFFKNKLKSFREFPKKIVSKFQDEIKKEADGIVKNFRKGILNDSLGLAKLKEKTIKRKKRKGFKHPTRPLVGKGSGSKKSYANMMEVTRVAKGYKIGPKSGFHWTRKVQLRKLFVYHEDAQRTGTPKRPALQIVLDKRATKSKFDTTIDPEKFTVKVRKK